MVAVISSSAYRTGVQFLSVYMKSVLTLVWPYIRSALFPHFYHSDWSQMMQQVQDGCSHTLGFTDFSLVQSSCDMSGQTSSMFLSILKPGWVSEGDPKLNTHFTACSCCQFLLFLFILFYCYRSMKPRNLKSKHL